MASVRRGGEVSWRPKEPSRSSSMAAWRRERWGGGAELLLQRLPLQRPRIGGGGSGRGRRHESRRQGGAPNRGPTSPPPVLCGARSPTSPAAAWRPWRRSRMPSPARGCCSPLRRLPRDDTLSYPSDCSHRLWPAAAHNLTTAGATAS
jgi:hypothetical protein